MQSNPDDKKTGYKTAFKATSIFGGVQFFTIIISILKSKLVAIWLGPAGFGILGLFSSVIALISSSTNLGLSSSAVRDIARAEGNEDKTQLPIVVKAISRWVLALGFIGALLACVLSPWLSKWTFGNRNYTFSFVILSVVILLTNIYQGQYAIFQGTRNIKLLAKSNIAGALGGFFISIPLFYFLREDGIVYSLIATAILIALISYYYKGTLKIKNISQSYKESFRIGKSTIKLGIMMAVSGIAVSLVEFLVKIFITQKGGIADVGFYQAAWTLNTRYLGLVFTAMATDYFPRLSLNADNNKKVNEQVNQQAEIAILILGPMIVVMLVFLPFFIRLLYSNDFMNIVPMTQLILIGSLIKAGSWAISFVFLAKGHGKTFLFNELGINLISLPFYILGYQTWKLEGIGIAFIANYTIYFIWVALIAYKKYEFKYSIEFWKLFSIVLFFPLLYAIANNYLNNTLPIKIVGFGTILLSSYYTINELNKRLNIVDYIIKFRTNK